MKFAFDVIEAWLSQPAVVAVEPTARHIRFLRDLLLPLGAGGNLTSDAHLAALAIENGAERYSSDGDFARDYHAAVTMIVLRSSNQQIRVDIRA